MKSFEVRRPIAASPRQVWKWLTSAEALVSGGLGVIRLDGTIEPGGRLKLWSEASPSRAFALRVTEFTPERAMVWTGGMPFGLFTGTRRFTLTPSGSQTVFHMREEFTGLLAPLIGRSIPDLTPSFEKFANGLRAMAEGDAR